MAIIDVLTVYGARKRAAHAAKTFKTRVSVLVKTGVHHAYLAFIFLTCSKVEKYLQ